MLELRIGNFAELFDAFLKIGEATGTLDRAKQLVAGMQAELDAVAARHKDIPANRRPRVFVEIWYDPMTTAGSTSFIDDVISRAGGINVAHEIAQEYPTVNPEKVIVWNPDVIIIAYMAKKGVSDAALAERIGVGAI